MTETRTQTQVRLMTEACCARAFRALIKKYRPACALTLVAFDFSDGVDVGPYSNLAYCTSLVRADMLATVEALLARWKVKRQPMAHDRRTQGWLPDEHEITDYSRFLTKELSSGMGFSLICGVGERTQYVSSAEREGVAMMLADDLLPGLRSEVAVG